MKTCSKCKLDKPFSSFSINKAGKNGLYCKCKNCQQIASSEYYTKNRNKIIQNQKDYYIINKVNISNTRKNYYNNNKDKIFERERCRMKNDSNFKILKYLRKRIRNALNSNQKRGKSLILLGCSIEEYKLYLQKTAIKNGYKDFDINNYSSKAYHIDHIKPCSLFNLSKEEDQKRCFNYKNTQILTAKINLSKGDRYEK